MGVSLTLNGAIFPLFLCPPRLGRPQKCLGHDHGDERDFRDYDGPQPSVCANPPRGFEDRAIQSKRQTHELLETS